MNYEAAMQLADALVSGKYQQGTQRLRRDDCYCIMGVACDLMGRAWKRDEEPGVYETDGWVASVPPEVSRWLGVESSGHVLAAMKKEFNVPGPGESLLTLNDQGVDFPTLSAIIRKHWKGIK